MKISPKRLRTPLAGLLSAGCLIALTGCQTFSKTSSEAAAIRAGHTSLVLFQATEGEAPRRLRLQGFFWPLGASKSALDGDIQTMPSSVAGREGWYYVSLKPGDYFFQLVPDAPGLTGTMTRDHDKRYVQWVGKERNDLPAYRLHIPPGAPVVYAGSFHFDRRQETLPGTSGHAHRCMPRPVRDRSAEAQRVANQSLSSLGHMTSSIVVPFDALPVDFVNATNRRLFLEMTNGMDSLGSDVGFRQGRNIARGILAPGLAGLERDPAEPDHLSPNERFNADVGGLLWILVTAPIAGKMGKDTIELHRKEWAPHEARLQKEWTEFHFRTRLAGVLQAHLTADGAGDTNTPVSPGPGFVLSVEPYRTYIRETKKNRFVLEVALHLKLSRSEDRTVLWEQGLVYSDWDGRNKADSFLVYPFETVVPASSPAHPLDDYKGDAGAQLLRSDMEKAVDALAGGIVRLLKARGPVYSPVDGGQAAPLSAPAAP